MGGWREEVWYSHYQVALLLDQLGKPWPEAMAAHLAAYEYQSDRAEPLYSIAMHYQSVRDFQTARLFFLRLWKFRARIQPPFRLEDNV